jgi:hypothetical protein
MTIKMNGPAGIFFPSLAHFFHPAVGNRLNTGDAIGHPSCDGGTSTGTHFHIARNLMVSGFQPEELFRLSLMIGK